MKTAFSETPLDREAARRGVGPVKHHRPNRVLVLLGYILAPRPGVRPDVFH